MSEAEEAGAPIEPSEVYELTSKLREAGEAPQQSLISVSAAITVLTILSSVLLVVAHRNQVQATLLKSRTADHWSVYERRIGDSRELAMEVDLLQVLPSADPKATAAMLARSKDRLRVLEARRNAEQEEAHEFGEEAEFAEARASRVAFGQAILQIGVLLASVTLYTRRRLFYSLGLGFGVVGFLTALTSFLMR